MGFPSNTPPGTTVLGGGQRPPTLSLSSRWQEMGPSDVTAAPSAGLQGPSSCPALPVDPELRWAGGHGSPTL